MAKMARNRFLHFLNRPPSKFKVKIATPDRDNGPLTILIVSLVFANVPDAKMRQICVKFDAK